MLGPTDGQDIQDILAILDKLTSHGMTGPTKEDSTVYWTLLT